VAVVVAWLRLASVSRCPAPNGDWEEWSECSASCAGGVKVRWRSGVPLHCRTSKSSKGRQQTPCNTERLCPDAPCEVGEWQSWMRCDSSSACGDGVTTSRYRLITSSPGIRGKTCPPLVESAPCLRTAGCPASCAQIMGSWQDWSGCSAMCNIGRQWRTRKIDAHRPGENHFVAFECETHGREFQYCAPDVGPCACHRQSGARPCGQELQIGQHEKELQAERPGEERVEQELLIVGLRAPFERRHLQLQDALTRDELLRILEDVSSERPVVQTDSTSLGVRAGWHLVYVGDALDVEEQASELQGGNATAKSLLSLNAFPAEVVLEGLDGSVRELQRCLRSFLAESVLNVSLPHVDVKAERPHTDMHGGDRVSFGLSAACSEEAPAEPAEEKGPPAALSCVRLLSRLNSMRRAVPKKELKHCISQAGFTAGGVGWIGAAQRK